MDGDLQRDGLTITRTDNSGGDVVLTATGALDARSAAEFLAEVQAALATGDADVTADLAAVAYCDSSGLAALVRAHNAAQRAGRRFTLRNPDLRLRRSLAITCLDGVLHITITGPDAAKPGD